MTHRSQQPCRPRERVTVWVRDLSLWFGGRGHESIWQAVDAARQARQPDDAAWPPHVFLPLEAAGRIIAESWRAQGRTPTPGAIVRDAMLLSGLSAWRVTQGIYRYDPTLFAALIQTPLEGDIPSEVVTRIPEWCIYIETPGMTAPATGGGELPLAGAFCWLDHSREGQDLLVLALDCEGASLAIAPLPLVGSLPEALAESSRQWRENIARGIAEGHPPRDFEGIATKTLTPMVSLLLYLCAANAEIGDGTRHPVNPAPKRTKDGWRLFPADKPATWDVGVRLGAALRRGYHEREMGTEHKTLEGHARPRAHVRRAHWHTYRIGQGRQDRRIKWLPPIPINVEDPNALPATVTSIDA